MSKTITAVNLQAEFEAFLIGRSVDLASVGMETLFAALIAFHKEVRVEGCNPDKHEDYLHYEGGNGVPYFERILYVPSETGAVETLDPDGPAYRAKWSLTVGPEFQTALAKVQNQPEASVNLWSMDFADADAFAVAVRAEPSFQAAVGWGQVAVEVTFGELG
ncbi:hypothetical protein ACFP81_00280 [Deinococcus lacus]|uniref:Uncharacterized protein n=1 Tax=Deinococcus lacus TaxID=392561 RepID=A0ABW1YCL2_9DEIO